MKLDIKDITMLVGEETTETFQEEEDGPLITLPVLPVRFFPYGHRQSFLTVNLIFVRSGAETTLWGMGGTDPEDEETMARAMECDNDPDTSMIFFCIRQMLDHAQDLLERDSLFPGKSYAWSEIALASHTVG